MLVTPGAGVARRRFWRRGLWASLLVGGLALLSLAPYMTSSADLVKMRNALLVQDGSVADFQWTPADVPPSFQLERGPVDPFFAEVAERLQLAQQPDDWQRVLVISRHLLGSSAKLNGGAVMSDLRGTYRRIVGAGDGYCGDFVDVFQALAVASGIPVRAWAFSFDGFGGHGHIWPEIWNRQQGRWQLVDIFNNTYFPGPSGEPMSAMELRRAMLATDKPLARAPLLPSAAYGMRLDERAWGYYRRGLPQWYMWWGNNVFSYDQAVLVRSLSVVSRSLEQLGGIAQGVHPGLKVLGDLTNRRALDRMEDLRVHLLVVLVLGSGALVVFVVSGVGLWRAPRAAGSAPTVHGSGVAAAAPGLGAVGSAALANLRIGLVGPLAPPAGGMANQTRQLAELLRAGGVDVTVVQTNAPYQPAWAGRLPGLRAVVRLGPYLVRLWRMAGRVDVVHLMANSGWAWHLFAAPALWVASWRGVPVVVNYRGGGAEAFLQRSARVVHRSMRRAAVLVVPSAFLQEVFARFGMQAEVVPNVIDLQRFKPRETPHPGSAHVVVTRNLEPVYDNATAIRAFALVRGQLPHARLSIAGSGPELDALRALTAELALHDSVQFLGRLDREAMAALYREADVVLNPSLTDNMPNSVLEALASAVPVVSTRVGGVPYIVQDRRTALLVPPSDPQAMAAACTELLENPVLWSQLSTAGLAEVRRYAWEHVAPVLAGTYRRVVAGHPLAYQG